MTGPYDDSILACIRML